MYKKWISILLAICMLFCLVPTTAFAAGSNNSKTENEASVAETAYATLAEAVNKAKDGETVTLLKDVTVSNTITIGKLITINGNNYTITAGSNTSAGETGFVLFKVEADNSKGGTNNSVTIENCKFEIPGNDATNAWAAILVERGTLSGLTIQNNSFNIEKTSRVPGKGVFQCVGLAYMPEDRVTTDITITGNTVTANGTPDMSDLTASTVNFVVGGTNHPDHEDGYAIGDYSIQNLHVTDNKLDGTNLVGVDVSNVKGLTVTGNTFNCLAAFRLATDTNKKTEEGKKQNTDITINNNVLGKNFYDYYMLYLSGNLPMTTDQTLSFPHVKYEQILMDDGATKADTFVKVGFDANGGKFTFENTSGCEFAARVIAQSTNGTQIDLPTPIRDGWNFDGWKAEVGTSSTQMDKDAKNYTVTDSVKLVAQWSQPTTYTVTYTDGWGGLWFDDDVHADLVAGTQTPSYTGGTPSHDGYDFIGWSPAVADTVTGNITYTAQWESKSEKLIKELLGDITVECVNDSSHTAKKYDTSVGGYSAVTREISKGKFTSTITVEAAKYVDRYNEETKVTHRLADGEVEKKTIVVEFDSNYDKITTKSGTLPVVFKVTCAQPQQIYRVDAKDLFKVKKVLNGREWNDTDSFTFTLSGEGKAPMPDENNRTAATTKKNQNASFGENAALVFTAPGEYVYYIDENPGKIVGIRYDTRRYKVVVTVTKQGDGTLTGATKYYVSTDDQCKEFASFDENIAVFTNDYTVNGTTVDLKVHKTLNVAVGQCELKANDFSFELREKLSDGTLSEVLDTATNNANGDVTFAPLIFSDLEDVGKKTYVISEIESGKPGIDYDTRAHEVSFSITDDGNGNLTASAPVYTIGGQNADSAEFVNTYTAKPGADVAFTPEAKKELTGRDMKDGEFTFEVTDDSDQNKVVSTGTNDSNGNITFSPIGFNTIQTQYTALLADMAAERSAVNIEQSTDTEAVDTHETASTATPETADFSVEEAQTFAVMATDNEQNNDLNKELERLLVHWYTIREVISTNADGITYDTVAYKVRVELEDVSDGQGILTVKNITYCKADGTQLAVGELPTFHNSYAAADSDAVIITLQKNLIGRALDEGEFTFALTCAEDAAHNNITATNDASGHVTFTLTYKDLDANKTDDSPIRYTYTVSENKGNAEGVSYDNHSYTFVVEVQDNGTGKMQATLVEVPEIMTFTNTYTPKITPTPTPATGPTPAPSATVTSSTKTTATPRPAATAAPAPAAHIPQTEDAFPLILLVSLLAISSGALALLITGKKSRKK